MDLNFRAVLLALDIEEAPHASDDDLRQQAVTEIGRLGECQTAVVRLLPAATAALEILLMAHCRTFGKDGKPDRASLTASPETVAKIEKLEADIAHAKLALGG